MSYMSNPEESKCPNFKAHTPCPEGYMQWHSWADRMSKNHHQVQCPSCGLFAIWVHNDKLPSEQKGGA